MRLYQIPSSSLLGRRRLSREQGAVLLASLFVVGVLGVTLEVIFCGAERLCSHRSVTEWNAALTVAEAGAEEPWHN